MRADSSRRSTLQIDVRTFSQLRDVVRAASGAAADWQPPDQLEYLASYLEKHGAGSPQSLLIESPYVDRHYLEEFSAYYANTLRPPPSHATRVHLFRLTPEDLSSHLANGVDGATAHTSAEKALNNCYLGFITVRPLPSAPIGRTVLTSYDNVATRHFEPATTEHHVHVTGFDLAVRGLPFQQQDQGVGACATTALWCALSRTIRSDGGRAPTPYALTAAATRHYVRDRTLPAVSGLEVEQMMAAIAAFGYSPYLFKPPQSPKGHDAFLISLVVYLRSGIPPILILDRGKTKAEHHAVTVVGFREHDNLEDENNLHVGHLRCRGVTRLYVHDDRIGPYVRMGLETSKDGPVLQRLATGGGSDPQSEPTQIYRALFPVYPKLRLTADDLLDVAGSVVPFFRVAESDADRDRIRVEMWFVLGGRYLRDLARVGVPDPERLRPLITSVHLSRYVGVIRVFRGEEAAADIICDTTDIPRNNPPGAPVLAAFAFHSGYLGTLRDFATSSAPHAIVA